MVETSAEAWYKRKKILLDLGIKIGNDSFLIRFYDKRDDFPFSIFRIPYLCSIISFKIFYSALRSEILRVARTTCICNEFKTSSRVELCRAWNQGDNVAVSTATATFSKYSGCYWAVLKSSMLYHINQISFWLNLNYKYLFI